MFGNCGTPGPVMLLINNAMDANIPIVFCPPKSCSCSPMKLVLKGEKNNTIKERKGYIFSCRKK